MELSQVHFTVVFYHFVHLLYTTLYQFVPPCTPVMYHFVPLHFIYHHRHHHGSLTTVVSHTCCLSPGRLCSCSIGKGSSTLFCVRVFPLRGIS